MADFPLLKVNVKNRFFSIVKNAPPLTKRRRLRYCASKSVQPCRLYPCQTLLLMLEELKQAYATQHFERHCVADNDKSQDTVYQGTSVS